MSRIVRNAPLCYGCKICQLVCSLHHTGSFWPERSSIQVSRNPQTGVVRWTIDKTCDRCKSEGEPLCVKSCAYAALKNAGAERQEGRKRE
jgi:Fe-S-cluster-containing hydrogenase component 2